MRHLFFARVFNNKSLGERLVLIRNQNKIFYSIVQKLVHFEINDNLLVIINGIGTAF